MLVFGSSSVGKALPRCAEPGSEQSSAWSLPVPCWAEEGLGSSLPAPLAVSDTWGWLVEKSSITVSTLQLAESLNNSPTGGLCHLLFPAGDRQCVPRNLTGPPRDRHLQGQQGQQHPQAAQHCQQHSSAPAAGTEPSRAQSRARQAQS